jgi:biopolymer transport protein ExbB/TolQ
MYSISALDLLTRGGFAISILLVCSVLSLAVVIEKYLTFKGISEKASRDITRNVLSMIKGNDLENATVFCKNYYIRSFFMKIQVPLAKVYLYIISKSTEQKDELEKRAFTRLDMEYANLEKRLGVLATLGSISPFIGLFGTVIGIIHSFNALAVSDVTNYAQVMSGIADALFATAAGLLVAVPAVLFYNYFMKKLRLSMPFYDESLQEVIAAVKNKKDK